MLSTVMHLFKGSQFIVGAASRHFWPNSAIANSTTHVFHNAVSWHIIAWEDSQDLRGTSEIYTLTALWSRLIVITETSLKYNLKKTKTRTISCFLTTCLANCVSFARKLNIVGETWSCELFRCLTRDRKSTPKFHYTSSGRHSRRFAFLLSCLRSHVLRAYCKVELKTSDLDYFICATP